MKTMKQNYNSFPIFYQNKIIKSKINNFVQTILRPVITRNQIFAKVCRASLLPELPDFHGFSSFHEYTYPKINPPLFFIDDEIHRDFSRIFQPPNQEAKYQSGIISASDVYVSFPHPIHKWKDKVFIEGIRESLKPLTEPRYLLALASIPFVKKQKMKSGILLAMPYHNNYYHWMVEMLPRLQMIEGDEKFKDIPIIVPKNRSPKFIYESIKLTGFSDRNIFLDDGVYHFDHLYIPSLLSLIKQPSPLAIEWLSKKLVTNNQISNKRRIYVSRRDALHRSITNEPEVEQMLSEFGFETVCLREHSLEEQVKIFQDAEIVIGSHGAGFSNIAFTPSQSILIELFQEGWFSPTFYRLAGIKNVKYGFLVCKKDGIGQYVNVNQLKELVEKAVANIKGINI